MIDRREKLYREFVEDLEAAQNLSERALNSLYAEYGPKRSIFYRMLLGRAQSILMSLVNQEAKRKEKS